MRRAGGRPNEGVGRLQQGLVAMAAALTASALMAGCQAGEDAPEPLTSNSAAPQHQADGVADRAVSVADARIADIADVRKAEQISGITLIEFNEYASTPTNTPLLRYLRDTFPGKYNDSIQDPQAVEYFVIANANAYPRTFWDLMELKGYSQTTISDSLGEVYEWYASRAPEMASMQQQPNLNPIDKQTIWTGRAALIACALIAEQISQGPVKLPEQSEQKVDQRVSRILEAGFGSRADYSRYYERLYFANLRGVELNRSDYPEEDFYPDFLQIGNKGTVGPVNSAPISGINRATILSAVDTFFQIQ